MWSLLFIDVYFFIVPKNFERSAVILAIFHVMSLIGKFVKLWDSKLWFQNFVIKFSLQPVCVCQRFICLIYRHERLTWYLPVI